MTEGSLRYVGYEFMSHYTRIRMYKQDDCCALNAAREDLIGCNHDPCFGPREVPDAAPRTSRNRSSKPSGLLNARTYSQPSKSITCISEFDALGSTSSLRPISVLLRHVFVAKLRAQGRRRPPVPRAESAVTCIAATNTNLQG